MAVAVARWVLPRVAWTCTTRHRPLAANTGEKAEPSRWRSRAGRTEQSDPSRLGDGEAGVEEAELQAGMAAVPNLTHGRHGYEFAERLGLALGLVDNPGHISRAPACLRHLRMASRSPTETLMRVVGNLHGTRSPGSATIPAPVSGHEQCPPLAIQRRRTCAQRNRTVRRARWPFRWCVAAPTCPRCRSQIDTPQVAHDQPKLWSSALRAASNLQHRQQPACTPAGWE